MLQKVMFVTATWSTSYSVCYGKY